ncbi:hypothetical protein, partial [Helicobacter sp. 13S00401-1]|uniref:hypothetical protein n=1 Tax=Helicobacter sp. 13S00401-1 TaxID=1905758 RepID=UPI0015527F7F
IFTTRKTSTLGLQTTISMGANSLGSTSSFNPQYSVNLDFIQAFKLKTTTYFKLGYIAGIGLAIRTNEKSNETSNTTLSTTNEARLSTPSILPTLKAGLIAFFGKHQAVSLEYQYYFRNTVQGMASSDISLNYTYYFGGK